MKILCIGDSLVNGFPFPQNYSFPSLMAEKMECHVINSGCNGQTSLEVKRRLESEIKITKCDEALILCGANDFVFFSVDAKPVSENIMDMVDICLKKSVIPTVITPILTSPKEAEFGWMPGVDYEYVNERIFNLEDILFNKCKEKGVKLIDLCKGYQEFSKYHDGIHPTKAGYEFISNFIIKEINKEEK